ncbi:MAG: discoidin domain-containing protein [Bacteroidaceae bacterium]|nr:discoidin domain-containing protein [Bacteroidaceae bacterium]
MKKIFTHLFAVLLLSFVATDALAQITSFTNGKVYHFQNAESTGVALGVTTLSDVAAISSDNTDESQLWYCEAQIVDETTYYTFRSLVNGRYLSGNGQSASWGLTVDKDTDANLFELAVSDSYITIRSKANAGGGYAYMHRDSGNNIVGWTYSGNNNTLWTITTVDYTDEQLTELWAAVKELIPDIATVSGYEEKLDAIFSDKACTALNSEYTSANMSDEELKNDENYSALPQVLKDMVRKVRGGDWSENNAITGKEGWSDDYAKRFRVQMYEPYSIEGEITSYLRFNAHCNMDNPTGIYANSGEPIYIMVDGDIADGAELWVAHQTGLGATGYYNNASYTQLHKGLNIVPYFNDASVLWINYVVQTYNSSGATIQEKFPENRRLSQYKPLKIHIEGGYINGFFNAMGDYRASATDGSDNLWGEVDNDEDWDYYKVRAPLNGTDAPNRDFPLLGHRQTLLFPLGQQANDGGGMENGLLYHLDNITVPTVPNCYGGSGNTFGSFDGSYSGMNLDASNGTINIMLEAWDRIMYSELATMGLVSTSTMDKMNALYPRWTTDNEPAEIYNYGSATVNGESKTYKEFCQGIDYSEYFNHHGAGVGAPSGYMSGGWRVCNYHYNTMGSIIGVIANEAGPTWGPAHEIGHQHQGVFNLNGQTEITNNFFSNVAVWYMGMGTSRVNGNEGSLNNLLSLFNNEDVNQYLHMTQGGNIWALTHLYYRLWLYYHLAGNNTQFWPRLFELCRQTPLENGTQISGETSLLRFYQHACDAAGEDLTEFFRAHGYFDVMDNVYVGDYTNATYNMTQEQIDAAIKSVKDKGYPVNYAALLINDATSETTVKHDGATKRSLWDGSATADLGSVNDFIDGDFESLTNYTATVSADGTVTMSGGEGGIGFLVLNEDGELVSFSNKTEFALNDEAAYLLATGKATIVAVDAESETVEAKVDLTAVQANLLSELISTVEALPMETDNSFTHVGFYTTPATESLRAALAAAKETAETGVGLQAAYELLYKEYTVLKESDPASVKVQLDPSLTYIVTNKAYPARTMTVVNNVVYANTGVDTTADAAKWQFKETATAGVYNVYNCSGIYCGTISESTAVTTTTEQASAKNYTVDDLGNGLWAISLNPAGTNTQFHAAANDSYKIVGWSSGAIASQWYITAVEANADAKVTAELQALIEKTENLVGTLATIENKYDEIVLQADYSNENYYIFCNNTDTQAGDGVKALLDNDNSTYLHSNWHSLSSSNDYLQVNLGTGNELDLFRITGVQRTGASADFPKIIEIKGSTDNSTDNQSWTTIATVKDLPQSATSSWERDVISVKSYPYLRFIVTTGTNEYMAEGERPYFHMAEFSIFKTVLSATLLDAYAEYSATLTSSLIADAYNGVELGKAWLDYDNATSDELTTYTATLQDKYDALYTAYKKVIDAEKAKLQSVIDDTEGLITQVGTATVTADAKIDLLGKLYAEGPYTAGGTSHSDYSTAEDGYNLLDGNTGTHFHSDYNYSTMVSPPYIRVDLGEGSTANKFKFNYTTRAASGCAPTTLNVYGSNEQDSNYTLLGTFTSNDGENPLPTAEKTLWTSTEITSATAYRYFKFEVAVSEGYKEENSVKKYYFAISEFGFQKLGEVSATINQEYTGMVSEGLLIDTRRTVNASETMVDYATDYVVTVEQIKAQTAAQQAAKDKLYAAMNNTAALKENLKKLIDDTQALYDKMATDEGAVNEYYSTSSLTADNLSEALTEIEDAQTVYDNSSATVDEINAAFKELNVKYGVLYGIEELNVAADARTDITGLIEKMEELLGEVADKTTAKTAIALQTTDANAEFYIWSNATAWDCNGIGALIDKNDDGTAKTGTFFGTTWDSGTTVNNYDHYITVDLGTEIALNELSIDYTTRNSDHSNQRPTSIKISASNDKEGEYIEIATLSEGMPVGQCAKWEMSSAVALNSYYRYIRFAVATEVGYFNMSDFNLYAHSAVKANDNYSTSDITTAQLFAMNAALLDGIAARDNYVTEENYNAALTVLQEQYNELLAIKNANVSDRNSLADLITETNTLIEEVATVSEEEAAIAMQCTDENASYYLYCNAPGKTNNYDGDDKGVTALLDNDSGTFLHTTYTGDSYDDDLDHYLRLDMGKDKALVSFKFNYVGRVGNTGNAPKTIVVEGSNDRENFEEITTLKNLPTADNATYQSDVITNGKAYRYIRFMVEETSNGSKYKEHQYFALSQFSVTACKTIEVKTEYVSPNLPLSTLVTANNEVVDATVIKNQFYVTETVYNTTEEELQAAYDALNLAKNLKELPVILTTDVNNPVLYKIYINRAFNNSAVDLLAYDGESMVDVADLDFESTVQNWYFMQGTDENNYGDVLILPASADGKALATNSFSEGTGKVSAQEPATEGYSYNWEINQIADKEWYNIKMNNGSDTYYYFSNHSGSGNKMGFYNSNTSTDGGSMFRFVLADAYSVLKDCYDPLEKEPEVYAPGYFSNAEQYNAAYDAASEYVNCANGTEEQYIAAYNELFAQKAALTTRTASHALEDGAVYRIMNLITNTTGEKYHYIANSNAAIVFPTTPAEDNNSDLWVCKANEDGTYEFVSALGTATLGWDYTIKETNAGAVKENATKFVVDDNASVSGAKRIAESNNSMSLTNELWNSKGEALFNRAGSNGKTQSENWSTDWYFQKVEDADVKFNVNISSRRFSSLYLPYDVEVPEGVSAFTAVNVDGNNVDLYRVADRYDDTAAGSIIPARTPVILYLEDEPFTAGVYTFTYAPGAEALSDAVTEKVDAAIIFGKILQTPILCDANTRYYKLGGKSGDTVSKMYWMYKEYGSDGTITNAGTDDGGYIRCSANKIYMTVAESVASNSFSMRFGIDSGTTDINEVDGENGSVETIYDLQGRKLNGITEPGMYIVNGKKVYVK